MMEYEAVERENERKKRENVEELKRFERGIMEPDTQIEESTLESRAIHEELRSLHMFLEQVQGEWAKLTERLRPVMTPVGTESDSGPVEDTAARLPRSEVTKDLATVNLQLLTLREGMRTITDHLEV